MKEDEEFVPALKTPDLIRLAVVKSLLDASGIPYTVRGEEGLRVMPVGGGFFDPHAIGAVLCVRESDLSDVQELLQTVERDWNHSENEP